VTGQNSIIWYAA